ncbi:MAG TPA: hypothetical protein PKK94_07725 [Leptospiraceae bacterium]|nr:hypothetical protein [Leptospiraceae bacterium]
MLKNSQMLFFIKTSFLIIFLFCFGVFSQTNDPSDPKNSIKNLTQTHTVVNTVDLTANSKKILAIGADSKQIEYKLTGETVSTLKEFGNMGLVITDKSILAVSVNASEFARQPFFGDVNINYTVSNSIIFVSTNRKVYIYSVSSSEWKTVDIAGEYVRTQAAFDRTGTLITNKRIIAYSDYIKDVRSYPINNMVPVYSYTVMDNKIVYDSIQKTIIFRAAAGDFTVNSFN